MIWQIIKSHWLGMPADFESNSIKDAETIMQAWADDNWFKEGVKSRLGKLEFHWINWNGIDTCTAFFHRNGRKHTFMKIGAKIGGGK